MTTDLSRHINAHFTDEDGKAWVFNTHNDHGIELQGLFHNEFKRIGFEDFGKLKPLDLKKISADAKKVGKKK